MTKYITFVAGPTNLEPFYTTFFRQNSINTIIGKGTVWLLETKTIKIHESEIIELEKILERLTTFQNDNINLAPRFKFGDLLNDEIMYYGAYKTNYGIIEGDGWLEPYTTYTFLDPTKCEKINCFIKNGKYYSWDDLLVDKKVYKCT